MPGMIANSRHPLDHPGHTRQGPQIAGEPLSPTALEQHLLDLSEATTVQFRFASSPPGAPQRLATAASPFPIPTADALATDFELTRDGRQNQCASSKQASCLLAPTLQSPEISSRTNWCVLVHEYKYNQFPRCVTVLCEIQ